jgi:hypothetical protein
MLTDGVHAPREQVIYVLVQFIFAHTHMRVTVSVRLNPEFTGGGRRSRSKTNDFSWFGLLRTRFGKISIYLYIYIFHRAEQFQNKYMAFRAQEIRTTLRTAQP